MRGDAEKPKHALIVSNMQSFAETVQSFAVAEKGFREMAHPK
jgi:hypothetical protein